MDIRETRTAKATNRDREDWYVDYLVEGNWAMGSLYTLSDGQVWRDKFKVQIKNGRFNVDIGTGSGVKVTFQVEG